MYIACNTVYEDCADTNLFILDTTKITDVNLQARLLAAPNEDWFEVDDDEQEEVDNALANPPQTIEKLLTIYVK